METAPGFLKWRLPEAHIRTCDSTGPGCCQGVYIAIVKKLSDLMDIAVMVVVTLAKFLSSNPVQGLAAFEWLTRLCLGKILQQVRL